MKKKIQEKRNEYKRYIADLRYEHKLTRKLGYEAQQNKIDSDISWTTEVLDLLDELEESIIEKE